MSSDGYTDHSAVVTVWFVTAADPAAVIRSEPRADRGFGRKYLAQLNPAWPVTPIGQFSLNRSAQVSADEFYIAGFPGVTIIQTLAEDATKLSTLNPGFLRSLPAADTYVFAVNRETGFGGFVHFRGESLKRAFSALPDRVYEDTGLPGAFESPFWAGERGESAGGIALPFLPIELVEEAQRTWVGFDPATSPDINVVAYAVDGRPEPRMKAPERPIDVGELSTRATEKLGLREGQLYDDYEDHGAEEGEEFRRLAQASSAAAKRLGRGFIRRARTARHTLSERLRHTDRDS